LQLLLKIFFVVYNYGLVADAFKRPFMGVPGLLYWSLISELLIICIINLPFLLLLAFFRQGSFQKIFTHLSVWFMVLLNTLNAMLTLFDIFYFHFQRQRANADLLFVIKRPWEQSFGTHPLLSSLGFALLIFTGLVIWRMVVSFLRSPVKKWVRISFSLMLAVIILCISIFREDLLLPTASLRNINISGTSIVQNSVHSFLFSVYRNKEARLPPVFPAEYPNPSFQINKVPFAPASLQGKNVVLFIMESIPAEFFTVGAKHKVDMPFLDSLVLKSRYFSNAYSYGHNSNKGITSILAGIPTLTEIPLYHSAFAGLPKTGIGDALAEKGYRSAFFIGDHYDDFGFAKCCNWLGIRQYFSRESIPGYPHLPSNSMGLQDEYVLQFMETVMDTLKQPFLSINYNTSTHYPNDIPEAFSQKQPAVNFTPEMRSMSYYSECIRQFFETAKTKTWYQNTVFIFCSDHWMYPDVRQLDNDVRESFHIPIFIFDPNDAVSSVVTRPVSQLDISSTILGIAGVNKPVINYGESLYLSGAERRPFAVCKENNMLYELIDSANVFGYNVQTRKPEFLYNFITDPEKKNNLAGNPLISAPYLHIIRNFLETAVNHYRGKVNN